MKCPEPYLSWRVDLTGLEGTWTWGWLKPLAGRGSNKQQGSSGLRTVGLRDCSSQIRKQVNVKDLKELTRVTQPRLSYPQLWLQRPNYSASSGLSKHIPPATEAQKGTLLVCSSAEGSGDRAELIPSSGVLLVRWGRESGDWSIWVLIPSKTLTFSEPQFPPL